MRGKQGEHPHSRSAQMDNLHSPWGVRDSIGPDADSDEDCHTKLAHKTVLTEEGTWTLALVRAKRFCATFDAYHYL